MGLLNQRKYVGVIVAILSLLLGVNASAISMCSDVFSKPSLRGYLIRKTLSKIDFSRPRSDVALNEAVASYYFYKKGDILKLSDFSNDPLSRRQLIFSRLLERQIQTDGVKFLFQKERHGMTPSSYQNFLSKWEEFRHSLVWQTLTSLPLSLPKFANPQYSEVILRDLVLNGEKSIYHEEGRKILDQTMRREFYTKLRRVYMVLAYSFVMYVMEDEISEAVDKAQEEKNEQAKEQFLSALEALEQQVQALEESNSHSLLTN